MRKELDNYLVNKYPNLYRDRHKSMRETAMCWGFECGDGWFPLIDRLSAKLEAEILEIPISKRELEKLQKNGYYCASQVKEKFGGLRFYMFGDTDSMEKAIGKAEDESIKTCEECGRWGKTRGHSWLYTACPMHTRDMDLRWWEYPIKALMMYFLKSPVEKYWDNPEDR